MLLAEAFESEITLLQYSKNMATVMPLMKAKGETIINDIAVDIGEAEKQQSKVKVVVV